ncbi:MAG: hypothetical protein PVG19_04995, partial [Desulfobacterales bacterium]
LLTQSHLVAGLPHPPAQKLRNRKPHQVVTVFHTLKTIFSGLLMPHFNQTLMFNKMTKAPKR